MATLSAYCTSAFETDQLAARFAPAPLDLRSGRELLKRVDTKYVCHHATALGVIASLAQDYAALPVDAGNIASYRSLYFDTGDLRCYHDHRRGRRLRHKVRIRHYPDRRLSFLEVKTKRNDVVTDKHRIELPFGTEELGATERAFLREHVDLPVEDLRPVTRIDFRRLSLLGIHTSERATIDFEISAERLHGERVQFGDLVVVEVKQAVFCVRTPIMRVLSGAGLREQSLSKYTFATALMLPELRRNRLGADVRAIERMLP